MKKKNKVLLAVWNAIKTFFTTNLLIKIVSLVFAVILWGYVMTNVNPSRPKTLYGIPVSTQGDADLSARNLVVRGDLAQILGAVDLRVATDVTHYFYLSKNNVSARVDLRNVTAPGSITLPVIAETTVGDIEAVSPSTITIEIDMLDSKRIPIEFRYSGELPDNYWHSEPVLGRTDIEITGPMQDVARVVKAVCDIPLDGLTESYNRTFDLTLYDENDNEVITVAFRSSVNPSVTIKMDVYPTKTVPVDTRSSIVGDDLMAQTHEITSITSNPPSVTIAGPQEIIDKITSVPVDVINVQDKTSSFMTAAPYKLPQNVVVVSGGSSANIEVRIEEKYAEYDFEEVEITAFGEVAGYNYIFSPNTAAATVKAPISVINALKEKEIKIVLCVDVATYSTPKTNIPVSPEPKIIVINEDSTYEFSDIEQVNGSTYILKLYKIDESGTRMALTVTVTVKTHSITMRVAKK